MKNKNKEKMIETSNSEYLSIPDCLKMIGMKEVAANIYSIPKKNKRN
jgi:hypothetical protein